MKIRTQVAIALVVPSIVVIAAGLNYSGLGAISRMLRRWDPLFGIKHAKWRECLNLLLPAT